MFKEIYKNIILFTIFGAIYCGLEVLWRGRTDVSMAICGGFAGVLVGLLNEAEFQDKMSVLSQCIFGMFIITFLEGCFGIILNVFLKLNIWDYSNMWGQFFFGQCCIPYCILWFFLSGVAIFLDDWLRYLMFDEPPKKYKWI